MLQIRDLAAVIAAHTQFAAEPKKAVRKWDGRTPYHAHPIWCAASILTETALPEDARAAGALALLYHDVLEDSTMPLPEWLTDEVIDLIRDMTFAGGSREEIERVWEKSPFVRLLKLYDKVSNLLDGTWMSEQKREEYVKYTKRLCEDVVQHYWNLNIVKIAQIMCG